MHIYIYVFGVKKLNDSIRKIQYEYEQSLTSLESNQYKFKVLWDIILSNSKRLKSENK